MLNTFSFAEESFVVRQRLVEYEERASQFQSGQIVESELDEQGKEDRESFKKIRDIHYSAICRPPRRIPSTSCRTRRSTEEVAILRIK